jgi:hypothetical protein
MFSNPRLKLTKIVVFVKLKYYENCSIFSPFTRGICLYIPPLNPAYAGFLPLLKTGPKDSLGEGSFYKLSKSTYETKYKLNEYIT